MVALSIRQPWAWLIVSGAKDIENRSWETDHRGPLWIHAGTTKAKRDDLDAAEEFLGYPVPTEKLLYGGVIGRVILKDCVRDHSSPWFCGPVGWVLASPVRLGFRRCPGKLGLFVPQFTE